MSERLRSLTTPVLGPSKSAPHLYGLSAVQMGRLESIIAAVCAPSPQLILTITLALCALTLVGFLVIALAPLVGVPIPAESVPLEGVVKLVLGLIGLNLYARLFRWIVQRPNVLLWFVAGGLTFYKWLDDTVTLELGFGGGLFFREISILVLILPGLYYLFRYFKDIQHVLPHALWYFAFVGLLTLYYFVYNPSSHNFYLANSGLTNGYSPMIVYWVLGCGWLVGAVGLMLQSNPMACFATTNRLILIAALIMYSLTVLGYPLHLFNVEVDGFLRSRGFFTHPNMFCHRSGILFIYLVGISCFYGSLKNPRLPLPLLLSTCGLVFLGLLLGFSKTSFVATGIACSLFYVLSWQTPLLKQHRWKILMLGPITLLMVLLGFKLISGQWFWEILADRIQDTNSLSWRTQTWNSLLGDLNGLPLLIGHGYTGAQDFIFRMSYNTVKNANPLVWSHNAYLFLAYDFGCMGLLYIMALLSLTWRAIALFCQAQSPTVKGLCATVLAMEVYYLMSMGFDETIHMFDVPLLFWLLSSMLIIMATWYHQPCQNQTPPAS
jgi:hypothetical protein